MGFIMAGIARQIMTNSQVRLDRPAAQAPGTARSRGWAPFRLTRRVHQRTELTRRRGLTRPRARCLVRTSSLAKLRPLVLGLLLAAALLAAPASSAQTWLVPAFPDQPALGSARATGAVIWSHGRSVDTEDSTAPTPPYMVALRDGGWDTFRFNRMRASDTLTASAQALSEQVEALKQSGYRQVALAGQSFGGFLALMAADESDAVDAVIATAPAAFGDYANFYGSWRQNARRLYPLLQQVRRARVMVFYFHGDDFDPGGRGERSRDILAERGLSYAVIDQPPRLTSHSAATTPLFAELYGPCILAFLDASQNDLGARCNDGTLWAAASDNRARSASRPAVQAAASLETVR